MTTVNIPTQELTSFDLPKVCVQTGRTEGVTFRPVKFSWYPKWIGVFAVAPLIMIILMAVLTRRAKGELPFSEEGWQAWKKAKLMVAFSVLGFIALLLGGLAAVGGRAGGLGMLLILASIVQLIVFIVVARGKGPACERIDGGTITLKLPSAEAAQRISAHLSGKSARVAA